MLTYLSWVRDKSALAHALACGCCGGSYADGAIILCTSISAMASLMWVKTENTDRKRFIEVVTRFPQAGCDPTMVSVPLLAQKDDSWKAKLPVSNKAFRYTESNDKTENEVTKLCDATIPRLDCRKVVRKYSYACLLYEQVRNGYIHTYNTADCATSGDALRDVFKGGRSEITYVNELAAKGMRKIHFPLEWISQVAKGVAAGLDGECEQTNKVFGQNLNLAAPGAWWIEGA